MNLQEIAHRFLRNAALIVGSRLVFGLLNLATNALVVKFFGLADLGLVVLLQAYIRLFSDLIKFDTWQAVLSFGAPLQEKKDDHTFRRLIGFTLSLDIVCLAVAVIGAILFIPFAIDIFKWPEEVAEFAPYFAISILFLLQGTPNGVLRYIDRVDVLAWQFALNATIRFVGVLLAIIWDGSVFHIVLAWFAANVLSGLLPMIFCFLELSARKLMPIFNVKWREANALFERIWRFMIMTNASNILTLVYEGGSVMVAGLLIGPSGAATLQIAKQFAAAISKTNQVLGPLISPEFARLAAMKDWLLFRKLIKRQLLITFGVLAVLATILFATLGLIIDAIYGAELSEYLALFQLLIFASLFTIVTFSFEPAVLAANRPHYILWLKTAAVALYIATTALLFAHLEIYAFGLGFLIAQIFYVSLFSYLGIKLLNKRILETATKSL